MRSVCSYQLRNLIGRENGVEITLPNKQNPNGIHVVMEPGEEPRAARYITLAWARKHGYTS